MVSKDAMAVDAMAEILRHLWPWSSDCQVQSDMYKVDYCAQSSAVKKRMKRRLQSMKMVKITCKDLSTAARLVMAESKQIVVNLQPAYGWDIQSLLVVLYVHEENCDVQYLFCQKMVDFYREFVEECCFDNTWEDGEGDEIVSNASVIIQSLLRSLTLFPHSVDIFKMCQHMIGELGSLIHEITVKDVLLTMLCKEVGLEITPSQRRRLPRCPVEFRLPLQVQFLLTIWRRIRACEYMVLSPEAHMVLKEDFNSVNWFSFSMHAIQLLTLIDQVERIEELEYCVT